MASSLPDRCEVCRAGGDWLLIVEHQGTTGAARCDCPRGKALAARSVRPVPPERAKPMLTAEEISGAVEGLAAMPWFPPDEGARIMVGDALAALCRDGLSCFELVRRMLVLYRQWPGVREMRICYCALIGVPLSGDDLHLEISEFYPDGFGRQVAPTAVGLALPCGHAAKDLNRLRRPVAMQQAPTNPNYKPITQADVDWAVQEAREKYQRIYRGEVAR